MSLPITKPYVIENVKKVWEEINLFRPNKRKNKLSKPQFDTINSLCLQKINTMTDLLWEINSIPTITRRIIFEMMNFKLSKSKYHVAHKDKKDLHQCFIDIGKTLEVAAISCQSLYYIYIDGYY